MRALRRCCPATGTTSPSSLTATNLVAGDTNGQSDVFVRDTVARHDDAGLCHRRRCPGQRREHRARPSPMTARNVLFTSAATNLVVGDTNGQPDAFVRLLVPGATIRALPAVGELAAGGTAATLAARWIGGVVHVDERRSRPTDTNAKADLFARTLG